MNEVSHDPNERRLGLTRDEVRARLFELMAENARVEASQLHEGALVRDELQLDSLDILSVVNEVEHEWRITVEEDGASEVDTVGEIVDLLWKLMGEKENEGPDA